MIQDDYEVLIETNGSIDLSNIITSAIIIMDIKTPSSGMCGKSKLSNLSYLNEDDEVKFVIGDKKDYNYAKRVIRKNKIDSYILFSPVWNMIKFKDLAEWIIKDKLDIILQIQLHKIIWGAKKRGV